MVSMVRVLQERTVGPADAALFASPEPLCRRRADAMVTKIFAVGGVDVVANTHLSSIECFDPSTGQWSAVAASMSTARVSFAVASIECPE